ncbi:hemerythrin domain-containing protein [Pseudomarimonas arenosa]|uniref:Hemerythrin domain-containing protein n=1 Tax=Pseudomarimonas arenosa TaxID=2774145 RepID=A0AAW3ZEM6_9GAMM|nr:hemerythrin domain-containing protein [Pseudomarimonas arenosa]MBD8524623.1 hemerythrin domain-containing protein [Pseudomarimonas arenosa]
MSQTIFETLRQDHDRQRRLVELLEKTEGDSRARRELFAMLKAELSSHAAAEERHFYAPLIACDLTQEKARHSIAEHHEIDELVESLEEVDMSSSAWLRRAKLLFDRVKHHLEEEEHEVFQLARNALSRAQIVQLGDEYVGSMEEFRAETA